jgi:hypothetical protein
MSVTIIVSLKVEDLDKSQAAFSSKVSNREEASIHAKVHRSLCFPSTPSAYSAYIEKRWNGYRV